MSSPTWQWQVTEWYGFFCETQIMKAFAFTVFLYMIFSLEIKILNLLWCAPRQDKEKVGQKVVSSWEGVRDRGQSRGCRKCSSPGGMFSYCVRARAYTHVLACVYSTCASTCTIYTCFTLPPTCVKLTGLQLSVFLALLVVCDRH